ncbi:MAG: hypothetical protein K2Q14_04575 [Gammaproteobacteria bacterium]|nr:hypothetical protein [Gammaproteobacteria bacterium]
MRTKITLALVTIGMCATAFAGAPGNNMLVPTGTPVIAPDSTGAWSFGLEALYMMSNTNFQYASTGNTSLLAPPAPEDVHNQSVTNDWNWGIEADVSYLFPGSSRDVSASYTYLDQDGDDSVDGAPLTIHGINRPTFTTFANEATGDVDQTLNAATLTFGQLLTIGNHLSLHPFGGVQFADIDTTNKAAYYTEFPGPGDEFEIGNYKSTSDFVGVGPRAGIDTTVHLNDNFSVVGTFAGALLVGSMSSEFDYNRGFIPNFESDFDNDSYTAVVPELDAKVGLDYMHAFNSSTSMNIQLGYEFVDYFNAEENDARNSWTTNSSNNSTDFSYNGPYLRLQVNIA